MRITTYDKESTTSTTGDKRIIKAFEPNFLPPEGGLVASTGVDPDVMESFGIFNEEQQERDGPIDHMTRVVAGARASNRAPTKQGLAGNIGGYVQVALFQKPQMTSSIVHRWSEDVIGAPVDPTKGRPLPTYLEANHDAAKAAE